MKCSFARFRLETARVLALLLAASFADTASAQQSASPKAQADSSASTAPQQQAPAPEAPDPASQQPTVPQASDGGQKREAPVGAAAAPVIRSEGVPASRPAGAAIAPAKQRRTRSYAIRVGLIVGAAVAVGAVTAASLSSSSRPH